MAYAADPGKVSVRAPDGAGNNAGGQAFSEYLRISPNSYTDNDDTVPGAGKMLLPEKPVGPFSPIFGPTFTDYNGTAPQGREISDKLLAGGTSETPSAAGHNEQFQFFAQFLTHDMSQGAVNTAPNAEIKSSAGVPNVDRISIDGVPFVFGRTDANTDNNNVRQQISEETSFLDLSMVYGSNQAMLDLLRDNQDTSKLVEGDGKLLPTVGDVAADARIDPAAAAGILRLGGFGPPPTDAYATGDQRANQTPMLLTLQTIFAREHNRLADEMKAEHPTWTADEVFNAARALNEAQWQHIVYDEYLPKLLGGSISGYSGYKAGVNPGATNEWGNIAFRFGHDQSSNTELLVDDNGATTSVTLADAFGRAGGNAAFGSNNRTGPSAQQNEQLDAYMRGMTQRITQEIDGKVADGNRNALFGIIGPDGKPVTVDLEAIDIQRGRDHGVSNLNDLREGIGLKTYNNVDQFVGQNNAGNALGAEVRAKLKEIYGNDIANVDSVVAGLLEKAVKGSILGETFHKIVDDQFERTRDGDKDFYLNRFSGNQDLIKEVQGTSFAELIMKNTDTIVYHDAFMSYNRTSGKGGAGRDLVVDSETANTQLGGAGNDDLYGLAGNDTQDGGEGNDWMFGGAGDDRQTGGKGSDIILFGAASGKDVIVDWKDKEDRIDLSELDLTFAKVQANMTAAGGNVVIDLGVAAGGAAGVNTITLTGANLNQMDISDFAFV
ncbi:hypothetical protein JMJ56_06910 [Belnapia sp. T18]|uniref:Animal haem peroxidase n=1 Tax=Belnapia arida TaxID=2804533 RepID=A0ABS1TZP8_9PROT|nr:peroxidase family protein [Belnapia arida]MBL6077730.1 hypothetical protein [Belnapia arida]